MLQNARGFSGTGCSDSKSLDAVLLDHETDPAAKAARVMDFHASSLVSDFLLNRQAPIPSLVSRKGYCYKMGLTHTVSRQSLASDFLHHSVAFFALAFEISAASFLFPYPF